MADIESKVIDLLKEKEFAIWSEGYASTGGSAGAHYHGIGKGRTFREACENFFKDRAEDKKYFNAKDLTYWGCKIYDNEDDASKTFG